jgi:hypothetical protein
LTSALDGGEWSDIRPGRFIPQGKRLWHPLDEFMWAPEPLWTRWWREKFPATAGTRTPDHPARNQVLSLSLYIYICIYISFAEEQRKKANENKFLRKILEPKENEASRNRDNYTTKNRVELRPLQCLAE